jgi:hypothetical protein
MRSMVEGSLALTRRFPYEARLRLAFDPSTTLRAVPLPMAGHGEEIQLAKLGSSR